VTRQWADRVTSNDPKVRADAATELAQGGERSLPLLRRFLISHNADVRLAGFEIAHRIGPPAIGPLCEMLRDHRVTSRRQAVDILIDLAPDTESIQPALCHALKDEDAVVAGDAARAMGALGGKAAASVFPLIEALSHGDVHVRLYAAEALASIGARAAPATDALAAMLHDPVPGVRWAACEGLASIGPAAAPAVPRLAEALKDEFLYVRICAAGALGSIGPDAKAAVESLREAAEDPALHAEAGWAIDRITGMHGRSASTDAIPVSIAQQTKARMAAEDLPSTISSSANEPVDWDTTTGRNIIWSVELGGETFGRPVVAGGVVYVGTGNARKMNPAFVDECGVLMAFRASDGAFLWQDLAPRVKRGLREFLLPSTTSAPYVEGDRLYYLTAECQLRCLDVRGFRDGTNDGPYKDESFQDDRAAADIIWELDLCAALGVFPHEACNSEVLPLGDLLVVCTSNGRNEGHTRVPSPRAPSLIAVDKRSGKVVWQAVGAGERVLHGQWCSPAAANVNGRTQVLFGGGDGWLRAYDAGSGRELWRFDGNPKDAPWRPRPGVFSRCSIVASPVYDGDGRVFIAMGEDPSHGNGPSLLHAVSPNGQGDVTDTRRLWTCRQIGRVVATPVVSDGLLYVADLGGTVYCVDAKTGDVLWKHDTHGAIWGCLLLAGQRLYAGNVEGTMTVVRAGRHKELLAEIEMDAPLYSRPALVGDTMYLASARRLYLINSEPLKK
jgi:outer membrane protein assembly factor BamB